MKNELTAKTQTTINNKYELKLTLNVKVSKKDNILKRVKSICNISFRKSELTTHGKTNEVGEMIALSAEKREHNIESEAKIKLTHKRLLKAIKNKKLDSLLVSKTTDDITVTTY